MIRSSIAYQWLLTFKERANQIDVALERLRTISQFHAASWPQV